MVGASEIAHYLAEVAATVDFQVFVCDPREAYGSVGSARTSAERRKRLADFDLSPQQIARLRGPVGLAIGWRTPPEIALAILADLVASRNGIVLEKIAAGAQRRRA